MTSIFAYDELTWPEVAGLPRETPLVLPIDGNVRPRQLAAALGNPPRIGLLPRLPYGWPESGLGVPPAISGRYVSNLLSSLEEDGFTHAKALIPGQAQINLESRLVIYTQGEAPPATILLPPETDHKKVVLIPIGHTEQHGLHLPLSVDTIIIEGIAHGTERAAPELCCSLPVMPYGVSTHRRSFAGTLSAGGREFEDFWLAVIDTLVARGFSCFYFMSGHGGNMSFLVNIVKYAGERHPRIFCATSFLHTAGPIGAAAIEKYRTSKIGGMGHAGELETSYMLHLRPDLCHMERVVDETDFVSTPSYYMDWIEGGSLIANPPWADDTKTGAYGAGSLATAEKGRLWLEAAVQEKVAHVREILEQHDRRQSRRSIGYGLWGNG